MIQKKYAEARFSVFFCINSIAATVLGLYNFVELVAWAHLAGYLERNPVALVHLFYRFKVHARVFKFQIYGAGCWAGDENLLACINGACLNEELAHAKL